MSNVPTIFIGAELETDPGYAEFVPELKIDSRLSDPAKIAVARENAAKSLAYIPVTGRLKSVCVWTTGAELWRVADVDKQPGVVLASWLQKTYPTGLPKSATQLGSCVFGFNIRTILRIAAFEGFRAGIRSPLGNFWWGRYQDDIVACDPYDDIMTTELIRQVSREALMRFLRVQPTAGDIRAACLAVDAMRLTQALGLV